MTAPSEPRLRLVHDWDMVTVPGIAEPVPREALLALYSERIEEMLRARPKSFAPVISLIRKQWVLARGPKRSDAPRPQLSVVGASADTTPRPFVWPIPDKVPLDVDEPKTPPKPRKPKGW